MIVRKHFQQLQKKDFFEDIETKHHKLLIHCKCCNFLQNFENFEKISMHD